MSRIGKKSLLVSKPAPSKRDPSHLDWHYKNPSEEELEDKYECFTEQEWSAHYQASKEEVSVSSRKKSDTDFMRDQAKLLACDGCQLFYQLWARGKGVCNPIDGADTPLDKVSRGWKFVDGEWMVPSEE